MKDSGDDDDDDDDDDNAAAGASAAKGDADGHDADLECATKEEDAAAIRIHHILIRPGAGRSASCAFIMLM